MLAAWPSQDALLPAWESSMHRLSTAVGMLQVVDRRRFTLSEDGEMAFYLVSQANVGAAAREVGVECVSCGLSLPRDLAGKLPAPVDSLCKLTAWCVLAVPEPESTFVTASLPDEPATGAGT